MAWPDPSAAREFFDRMDRGAHEMIERSERAAVAAAQIAAAKAQEDAARATADEARARATAITEAKAEGSAARARKGDLVIFAALADVCGYMHGTDLENARALLKDAAAILTEPSGEPMNERKVAARFKEAREHLTKDKN